MDRLNLLLSLSRRCGLAVAAVLTIAAAGAAPLPPVRELALEKAPAPLLQAVQQSLRAQPSLSGLRLEALEVLERDLDHDGRAEWLVIGDVIDEAGLRSANRPLWLFSMEGGTARLRGYLGVQTSVEPVARAVEGPKGWDDLRLIAKQGPRQRCVLLGAAEAGRYQQRTCCDPGTGRAAACAE